MADCETISCGICYAQHVTKNADSWCPECEEGFCSECLKHHNVSKYTKSHEVISIENYQKLPPAVSKIVHHCPEHDKSYQNYCTKHESLCCPLCISTNHRSCVGELLAIEEIIKSLDVNTTINNLKTRLNDLTNKMVKIIKDREDNLVNIGTQRQKCQDKVQLLRKRINDHLDKLETNILEDLNAAKDKIIFETDNQKRQLKEKLQAMGELQNTLAALQTHASGLQVYICSKQIQANLDMEEKYTQSIIKKRHLNPISLILRTNDSIANILSTIESFGSIYIAKGASYTFKFKREEHSIIATHPTGVLHLELNNKFAIPKSDHTTGVRACVFMKRGELIVVDSNTYMDTNNRLIILNPDGMSLDELPLPLFPVDMTSVDDNHLAISTGSKPNILIIKPEFKTFKRTINCTGFYHGITYSKGKLFCTKYGTGVKKIDLNSDKSSNVVRDNINYFGRITTYYNKLYYTNAKTHTVTCCSTKGKIIWQFKDKSVLVEPRGIAVDTKLNVYVASYGNDSILVISPDGSNCMPILGKEDGIDNPFAIYFDRQRNCLVVTNYKGEIFLYKVNHS